jgi:hypothetical protein
MTSTTMAAEASAAFSSCGCDTDASPVVSSSAAGSAAGAGIAAVAGPSIAASPVIDDGLIGPFLSRDEAENDAKETLGIKEGEVD